MINTATYEVNLYLNGRLIGNCRRLAQNLSWTRRRTKVGVDSIDFTINDVLFDQWCRQRSVTINDLLKPLALECRVVRNGVELVGGFLATMPGYSPLQQSANLAMRFDGYLNLLNGVYIRNYENNLPLGTVTKPAAEMVQQMIDLANQISGDAGKSYGLVAGELNALNSITNTFDNYKTVKEWICERCDNETGAGAFEVYFHPDKTYDVLADAKFGDVIHDWVAYYPALQNAPSASSISASEVDGFASATLALGAGEVSSSPNENTALFDYAKNDDAVKEYGYFESLIQDSSVSQATTLRTNLMTNLKNTSKPIWSPEITLHGRRVTPVPSGSQKIWVGDTIIVRNSIDLTGMTNGHFRVNELKVDISANGGETITPVLERVDG